MKKHTDKKSRVREMLLANQSIKAISIDLDLPTASIHRTIPEMGIRHVWVTDDEWKALCEVRKIK